MGGDFATIDVFPEPVPTEVDGSPHYQPGSDPTEKFLPSKLEDVAKSSIMCHFPPLPKQQNILALRFRVSRAINLYSSIQKRWLKGFIKNQQKDWWKNLTSCADPSCPSMREPATKRIGSC